MSLLVNPWLQRFLIAAAAGFTATGAVVATSKRPHKLKKKKLKKKKDGTPEPVEIGAQALRDARLAAEHGLTAGEWRDAVVARSKSVGQGIAGVFKRTPKQVPVPDVTAPGALEPDEVDGKRLPKKKQPTANKKKKRRRRGGRRKEATLWDSAKESLKQTVKETVRDEVKQSPVGGAFEKLKDVGAKVQEGAASLSKSAGDVVNKAMENAKENAPEQRDALKRTFNNFGTFLSAAVETVRGEKKKDGPKEIQSTSSDEDAAPALDDPNEPLTPQPPLPKSGAGESEANDASAADKNAPPVVEVVSTWVSGGKPHSTAKRVKPSTGGDDVVDAKDGPEHP